MILGLGGLLEGAEREARAAVEILAIAPPARAYALAILAQALLALRSQGDRAPRPAAELAAEALGVACEAMALLESLGFLEEGETLVRLAHAESLAATGNVAAARTAIATARSKLVARAAKIKDESRRKSFLERVPENARTLALAGAWSGPG
jgi:hypothetical protein